MTHEEFYQSVVLSYINHDGNPVAFFDDVVAALNQFREEKQAAQQNVQRTAESEEPLRDDEFQSWHDDPGYF